MSVLSYADFAREVLAVYEPPLRQYATWAQMRQVLREFAELELILRT